MPTHESKHFGFYLQKGLFRGVREPSAAVKAHDLADPSTPITRNAACAGPVVDGVETRWRFREGSDPYVDDRQAGSQFYGNA